MILTLARVSVCESVQNGKSECESVQNSKSECRRVFKELIQSVLSLQLEMIAIYIKCLFLPNPTLPNQLLSLLGTGHGVGCLFPGLEPGHMTSEGNK